MTKYVCRRDQVCAGLLLIKDFSDIIDMRNNRCIDSNVVRGILFSIDTEGYANDLVFNNDYKYPINNLCNDNKSSYYISDYIHLEELLRYLGYNNDLTHGDIKRIYKKFILHNRWLRHNKEIFGLLKMSGGSYGEGGLEMVSVDIYNTLELIKYSLENRKFLIKSQQKLIKRREGGI